MEQYWHGVWVYTSWFCALTEDRILCYAKSTMGMGGQTCGVMCPPHTPSLLLGLYCECSHGLRMPSNTAEAGFLHSAPPLLAGLAVSVRCAQRYGKMYLCLTFEMYKDSTLKLGVAVKSN